MKKIYSSIILFLSIWLLLSCTDFMSYHQKYIEDGEIIYAPMPDSIAFYAGRNRIMFRFWLYNSPNVNTVEIDWNDGLDALSIPVTPSTGRDSIDIILPDMEEKSYTFNVHTVDNYGHTSLVKTDFGTAYSDNYQNSLSDRRIRGIELTDTGAIVSWYSAAEDLVRTEIKYLDANGKEILIQTSAELNETICPDVIPFSEYSFRSLYIPESESIDTFATAWTDHAKFPPLYLEYDRSSWEVIECSDETASDGGGMTTLIDGDLDTYWHSQWEGGYPPLPHWATIDMKKVTDLYKIHSYRRKDNKDTRTIVYYVSNNNVDWTEIGRVTYEDEDGDFAEVILDWTTPPSGRYLRVSVEDSNNDNDCSSIAEIYVFGKKD